MSDQETADKYPQVVAVLDWDGGLSDAELASSGFCSAVARQKPRGQTIGGRGTTTAGPRKRESAVRVSTPVRLTRGRARPLPTCRSP
jgi:hypothetical protein